MDFAARIRRRGKVERLEAVTFARLVGLDHVDLTTWVLPLLTSADVVSATVHDGEMRAVEEFVGVAAPFLQQVATVWRLSSPPAEEECALESADLAAHAPLTESDHMAALEAIGFTEDERRHAVRALEALGLLQRAASPSLREDIIFNEYVWGDSAVSIAAFLKGLPPAERDVLTLLSSLALQRPGLPVAAVGDVDPDVMRGARKVGFLDPATVTTTTGQQQAFVFSPALEQHLALKETTDALHERKLFVAHIMFGYQFGFPGTGRIQDPAVLVRALLRRGSVGPASAITTDYPLLESHGIVRVKESSMSGRSYLELVKEDVVSDALELLEASSTGQSPDLAADDPLASLWLPGGFVGPEDERVTSPELRAGPAKELFDYSILRLREAAARMTRGEELFE